MIKFLFQKEFFDYSIRMRLEGFCSNLDKLNDGFNYFLSRNWGR